MKPYPFQNLSLAERVFNYRSSNAGRENAVRIAASRIRIFQRQKNSQTYYSHMDNKGRSSAGKFPNVINSLHAKVAII